MYVSVRQKEAITVVPMPKPYSISVKQLTPREYSFAGGICLSEFRTSNWQDSILSAERIENSRQIFISDSGWVMDRPIATILLLEGFLSFR